MTSTESIEARIITNATTRSTTRRTKRYLGLALLMIPRNVTAGASCLRANIEVGEITSVADLRVDGTTYAPMANATMQPSAATSTASRATASAIAEPSARKLKTNLTGRVTIPNSPPTTTKIEHTTS